MGGLLYAQSLQSYADRLQKFGQSLQQEEVFIHMDNSSYFLGDTIFYKAYVMKSEGKLSNLSGLLYVELFNQDGYLVERQKLKLEKGQAAGSIALPDTLYGGFYELRAYTRWQLNWGQTEHAHTKSAEQWFYSKKMAKDYYRDYDKLYSRVFPVFDKPKTKGDYVEEMTLRPLRRYFKKDMTKRETKVTLYPEGGHLIQGVPCRVAFDAQDESGTHLTGTLSVLDANGAVITTGKTENRGRGIVTFTPQTEKVKWQFSESDADGKSVTAGRTKNGSIQSETDGCALQADVTDDGIHITLCNSGTAATEELGLTAMCHGLLMDFQQLPVGAQNTAVIPLDKCPTGVIQLTVFNAEGRIYADRLVFVRHDDFQPQTVSFSGISSQAYPAFAPITMVVHGQPSATLSLAVRDASHSEYLFDSGNILTEMLLSSQLKGFVEAPEYYFETNDAEHQRALDLLLMVQGWRRYNWVEMAVPKQFTLNYMPEKTELLTGSVNRYETVEPEDLFADQAKVGLDESKMSADYDEFEGSQYGSYASSDMVKKWGGAKAAMMAAKVLKDELHVEPSDYDAINKDGHDDYVELRLTQSYAQYVDDMRHTLTSQKTTGDVAAARFNENQGNLKREVRVHAEFTQIYSDGKRDDVLGDMTTNNNGAFQISAPGFYDKVILNLAASDTTKWKAGKTHEWVRNGVDKYDKVNFPEFYVKMNPFYPRFVKPYNAYQTQMRELPKNTAINKMDAGVRNLNEVTVRARHSGLNTFDASKPAFVIDAYQAFNDVCDAGLCPGYFIGSGRFSSDIARVYIGDMNMERHYDIEQRFNGFNRSHNFSNGALQKYSNLANLDKVYIYTDYSPRLEGDERYQRDNQPVVTVDLHRYLDDAQRMTYLNRWYVLTGYNQCEDFYQPDYSTKPLPTTKDYRRTLYWNPNLQLDSNGRCSLKFYNNSKSTQITVSAEGLTPDGAPQTGISYPETR